MVHGVSQDRRLFAAQVEEFRRSFRILLIDLPGHGRSAGIPGPYGLTEFALSIEAALDEAAVDASHLWGTHLGAGAGLLLAARAPERFHSLILEAPVFPGRPLPAVALMLERIRSTVQRLGIEHARKQWFEESEWFAVIRQNPTQCRAHEHWEMISEFCCSPWLDPGLARPIEPVTTQLASLQVPTLIVNGQHDLADFLEVADALERLLPNCRRVTIPNGGGFPLWEYPENVNAVVRGFLAS